jgi:hypothetical protein
MSLEEALNRIADLERKIAELSAENERLRNRKTAGRKLHDDAWMASYNDFMLKYKGGKTLMEIVDEGGISRRTAYRYLEYYKKTLSEM